MTASWDGVHTAIVGLGLNEDDFAALKMDLHRVFGARPDSAQKAMQWLGAVSSPCGGRPLAVLAGLGTDLPREIGIPRVLSYLRNAADAPA